MKISKIIKILLTYPEQILNLNLNLTKSEQYNQLPNEVAVEVTEELGEGGRRDMEEE